MENELVCRLHKGHLGLNPCLTFLTHPFAVPSRLLGPKRIMECTVLLCEASKVEGPNVLASQIASPVPLLVQESLLQPH